MRFDEEMILIFSALCLFLDLELRSVVMVNRPQGSLSSCKFRELLFCCQCGFKSHFSNELQCSFLSFCKTLQGLNFNLSSACLYLMPIPCIAARSSADAI